MGTETYKYVLRGSVFKQRPVKLNNPLMGTETFINFTFNSSHFIHVKLNNPLMGTETLF